MVRVWWTAIAAFLLADLFFYWCSYDLISKKWYQSWLGSGFLGCFWLLRRAWMEREEQARLAAWDAYRESMYNASHHNDLDN